MGLKLDDDAGDSDFDLLEGGDGDDEDDPNKIKFADFFGEEPVGKADTKKKKIRPLEMPLEDEDTGLDDDEGGEEEDEDSEDAPEIGDAGAAEDLSDEEKELEEQIRKMQKAEGIDAEGDDEESEEEGPEAGEEDAASGDSDDDAIMSRTRQPKSLYEMDRRLQSLEDEVAKLEDEQMEEKNWTMRGE